MDSEVAEGGAENSARSLLTFFQKTICRGVANAEEKFSDTDVISAEEFVVTEGIIDGVMEDPDVGEFARRFVGGDGFDFGAKFFDGFGEVLAIFVVNFDSGRRDGADFVGDVVGRSICAEEDNGGEEE